MSERPEPYLFERIWSHPAAERWEDPPIPTAIRDDADRLVGVRYEDGGQEAYEYDELGQLVAIDEFGGLEFSTGYPAYRVDTGGRLRVEHDDEGLLRIVDKRERVVWERLTVPFEALFERGVELIADRCVKAFADVEFEPGTEIQCLRLIYRGAQHVRDAHGPDGGRPRGVARDRRHVRCGVRAVVPGV